MGWKRVMVKYSTNFWSFLTKSTTFLRFLILKLKNEIKIVKKYLCCFYPLNAQMGIKRVMVKYSTNFWSFLTKCTTFLRFLTLKNKNEIKIVKKKTCAAFNPKTRKWALNELWWYIRQTFCVFWPKVPLSWDSWHQNKRTRLKSSKKNLCRF